jgi:hypothetical protein
VQCTSRIASFFVFVFSTAHPHIWRAQVFTVLGTVKEVDIDTRTVQPSKSKYFQFTCAAGVDYFVLFALFEDKRLWLRLGLPMSGDDVLAAREAGLPIDEKKILEDEAKRGAQVFKSE